MAFHLNGKLYFLRRTNVRFTMMRLLIRWLLLLCFLSSGGYAHTHQHRIGYLPEKITERSVQAGFSGLQNDNATLSQAPSPNKENKVNEGIRTTEMEDDDESDPSKKHAATSNCSITFYAQASGDNSHYFKNRLPFCEHFSWSSYKFILHGVIRI
jgi:hypothetical protein